MIKKVLGPPYTPNTPFLVNAAALRWENERTPMRKSPPIRSRAITQHGNQSKQTLGEGVPLGKTDGPRRFSIITTARFPSKTQTHKRMTSCFKLNATTEEMNEWRVMRWDGWLAELLATSLTLVPFPLPKAQTYSSMQRRENEWMTCYVLRLMVCCRAAFYIATASLLQTYSIWYHLQPLHRWGNR